MPLALSPSWATNSSSSLGEEKMGNMVDGYFPEVLAMDLERSSSIFAARRMTSGPPATNLSTNYDDANSSWPYRSTSPAHHTASGAGRALGPIQERTSVVSFLDQPSQSKFDVSSSDEDEESVSEISRGAGGRSTSVREQSIATAATSLESSSRGSSPRNLPQCGIQRTYSWIDADSDDEEGDVQPEQNEDNLAMLSPRPPTPPESDTSAGSKVERQETRPSAYNRHRKSYSLGGPTPVSPPRRRRSTQRSLNDSNWSPATAPHNASKASAPATPPVHRPRASSLQTSRSYVNRMPASHHRGGSHGSKSVAASFSTEPTYMGDVDTATEDEPAHQSRAGSRNPIYIRPSPPPSPLPSVESWLNGSILQHAPQFPGDELTKAIPLPPNVVETLRVSIACFPETMLLNSSLTLETIRNYSKKVRQPSSELATTLTHDPPKPASGGVPRKSLWKRVVAYKRGPSDTDRHRSSQSPVLGSNLKSSSSTSLETPKPWASMRNVFGCCSDYILDALWAHIVAYNYISALVPRSPPRRTSCRGRTSPTSSDKEEIPKKAATLLGLSSSPDADKSGDRVARQPASQLPWAPQREGMVTDQSSRSATYDSATRDIQAGLMRCIMRLIATAKLMSEDGTSQDRVVEMEARGVDVLLTRSLCEIVRMTEESH